MLSIHRVIHDQVDDMQGVIMDGQGFGDAHGSTFHGAIYADPDRFGQVHARLSHRNGIQLQLYWDDEVRMSRHIKGRIYDRVTQFEILQLQVQCSAFEGEADGILVIAMGFDADDGLAADPAEHLHPHFFWLPYFGGFEWGAGGEGEEDCQYHCGNDKCTGF